MPKESWDKVWEDAKKRVREYYIAPYPKAGK
jgi:hypothetical protein